MHHRKLLLLLTTVFTSVTSADTIFLLNGDKLSGKIKLVDSNKVLIETEYSNVLTIILDKIITFSIDTPVNIKQKRFGKLQQADKVVSSKNKEIKLVVKDSESAKFIPLNKSLTIIDQPTSTLDFSDFIINGNLNAGVYYNKGEDTTKQYFLNSKLNIQYNLWRQSLSGEIFRTKISEQTTSYYYNTQYELDRFFSKRFFAQGSLNYKHDWVEPIKAKKSIGFGPGWQLWQNELSALSLTTLINYQYIDYRIEEDLNATIGIFKWNYYRYLLGKSIKLYIKGNVGRSYDDSVIFELSTTMGINYKLTERISLNASLVRDKTKTQKGNSSNTNYGVGIGIKW